MKQSLLSIARLVCCAAFAQSIGKENYKKSLNGPVSSIRVITYKALDKGGGNYGKGEIEKGMENFLICLYSVPSVIPNLAVISPIV